MARRTAERVDGLLRKSGRSLEPEGDEPPAELLLDEPGLASCYAAAQGRIEELSTARGALTATPDGAPLALISVMDGTIGSAPSANEGEP